MSLQAILDKIRASGETKVKEIESNAQSQVNELLVQARMDAGQIEQDSLAAASAPAVAERARILHRARLESLRIVGDVREDLVDTAISRARERLASFRRDSSYQAVLFALTREALAELPSGGAEQVELLADPRDETVVDHIISDLKLNAPVTFEL